MFGENKRLAMTEFPRASSGRMMASTLISALHLCAALTAELHTAASAAGKLKRLKAKGAIIY